MRGLTKNVGNNNFKEMPALDKDKVKRVLICRPNHRLGNMLLITPLVQEVERTFPNTLAEGLPLKKGAMIL